MPLFALRIFNYTLDKRNEMPFMDCLQQVNSYHATNPSHDLCAATHSLFQSA